MYDTIQPFTSKKKLNNKKFILQSKYNVHIYIHIYIYGIKKLILIISLMLIKNSIANESIEFN